MTYRPSVLVTTGDDLVPCVSLMMMTVAPGMTPPCASVTVPVTAPVVICADAGAASPPARHRASASTAVLFHPLIVLLLLTSPPFRPGWATFTQGESNFGRQPRSRTGSTGTQTLTDS